MACAEKRPDLLSWKTAFRNSIGRSCRLEGLSARHQSQFDKLIRDSKGAGFPHLGVKSLVEQLNKLLMHYGCRTSVGLKMQLLLELLTLEMGILSQRLQESYKRYGPWITAGWFKFFGIKWICLGTPRYNL